MAVAQPVSGCCLHMQLHKAVGSCRKWCQCVHRGTPDSAESLTKPTSETTFSPMSNHYYLIRKPSPTKSEKRGHGESCGNTVLTSWSAVGWLREYMVELDIYRLSATILLPRLFVVFVPLDFSLSLSW